jgi:hypothetical protein
MGAREVMLRCAARRHGEVGDSCDNGVTGPGLDVPGCCRRESGQDDEAEAEKCGEQR